MPAGCGAKGYRLSIDGPWDDGGGAGWDSPTSHEEAASFN